MSLPKCPSTLSFIFFLFRSVLFQEIRQQQINSQKYNETIFTQLYTSSLQHGSISVGQRRRTRELVSTNNSSHSDMFRARELLRKKFNNYLNQSAFYLQSLTAVFCFTERYASYDSLRVAYTLSTLHCVLVRFISPSRLVKDQEWYKLKK